MVPKGPGDLLLWVVEGFGDVHCFYRHLGSGSGQPRPSVRPFHACSLRSVGKEYHQGCQLELPFVFSEEEAGSGDSHLVQVTQSVVEQNSNFLVSL